MTDRCAARVSRRRFAKTASCALGLMACGETSVISTAAREGSDGRLTARPRAGVTTSLSSGPLGLGGNGRDGIIQMPPGGSTGAAALLVFLHGATQSGDAILRRIAAPAEQSGVAIVALDSRGPTWDAIRGGFGADVAFLNRALEFVFGRLSVDPTRVGIGGFSDGASYALSIGLANGDLFPRVVACSPGFVIQAPPVNRPRIFVSHGTSDQVLPIDRCSRIIVPRLRSMGYEVTFREFEGRHELPAAIASEALAWMGE